MKDQSNVTLLMQKIFCNMFSKIFLDHILNLRIPQLLDFFDFSGFASNLKPSLVKSVKSTPSPLTRLEKNLIRKKTFHTFPKNFRQI